MPGDSLEDMGDLVHQNVRQQAGHKDWLVALEALDPVAEHTDVNAFIGPCVGQRAAMQVLRGVVGQADEDGLGRTVAMIAPVDGDADTSEHLGSNRAGNGRPAHDAEAHADGHGPMSRRFGRLSAQPHHFRGRR